MNRRWQFFVTNLDEKIEKVELDAPNIIEAFRILFTMLASDFVAGICNIEVSEV